MHKSIMPIRLMPFNTSNSDSVLQVKVLLLESCLILPISWCFLLNVLTALKVKASDAFKHYQVVFNDASMCK